jgi:hypothetical protein
MVASNNLGFSSKFIIRLSRLLELALYWALSSMVREKKLTSEPEINADRSKSKMSMRKVVM